ncbi:MAG: dockerin type I repeat-containing protein [Candidatus Woesearchaeota archaeon]
MEMKTRLSGKPRKKGIFHSRSIFNTLFSRIILTYLAIAIMIFANVAFASQNNGDPSLVYDFQASQAIGLGSFGKLSPVTNENIYTKEDKTALLTATDTIVPVQGRVYYNGDNYNGNNVNVCIDTTCNNGVTAANGIFNTDINFTLEDPHSPHTVTVTVNGTEMINKEFYLAGGPQGDLLINGILNVTSNIITGEDLKYERSLIRGSVSHQTQHINMNCGEGASSCNQVIWQKIMTIQAVSTTTSGLRAEITFTGGTESLDKYTAYFTFAARPLGANFQDKSWSYYIIGKTGEKIRVINTTENNIEVYARANSYWPGRFITSLDYISTGAMPVTLESVSNYTNNPASLGTIIEPENTTTQSFNIPTGNVGIGTTAPGFKLDVAGQVNASGLCINGVCQTDWTSAGKWSDGVSPGDIYYDGGKVGINTTDPQTILHLKGEDLGVNSSNFMNDMTELIIESKDSGLELISSDDEIWGSKLSFAEVDAGVVNNKWGILRQATTGGDGSLRFTYGTNNFVNQNPSLLIINNTGNVGIGTDDPGEKLEVNGTIKAINNDFSGTLGGSLNPDIANNILHIDVGGSGHADADIWLGDLISSANDIITLGNLGIGETNPTSKLHVKGVGGSFPQLNIENTAVDGTSGIRLIAKNDTSVWDIMNFWADGRFSIRDNIADIERFVISETTGNVGIGVTDPIVNLHIAKDYNVSIRIEDTNASEYTTFTQRQFDGDFEISRLGSGGVDIAIQPDGDVIFNAGTVGVLQPNPNNSYAIDINGKLNAEQVCIDGDCKPDWESVGGKWSDGVSPGDIYYDSGNVGIGTNDPKAKLDVNGTVKIGDDSAYQQGLGWVDLGIAGSGVGTANSGNIILTDISDNKSWGIFQRGDSDTGNDNDFALHHYDGSAWTKHFTIEPSGEVGIGTDNPTKSLHVESDKPGTILAKSTNSTTYGGIDIRNDNDAYFLVGVSGSANPTVTNRNNGVLVAQNGITINTNLSAGLEPDHIFAADGNVGIGTAVPKAKLDVNGYVKIGNDSAYQQGLLWVDLGIAGSGTGAANSGNILFTDTANNKTWMISQRGDSSPDGGSPNDFALHHYNGTTFSRLLTVNINGSVGIREASPQKSLHIDNDGNGESGIRLSQFNNYIGLNMYVAAGSGHAYFDRDIDDASYNTYFRFRTSGTPVNVLTLLGTGKVGIDTTAPIAALHVNGSIFALGGSGDVNGDSFVDSTDMNQVGNYLIGSATPSMKNLSDSDIDGDGLITYNDYYSINDHTLGRRDIKDIKNKINQYGMITFGSGAGTKGFYLTPNVGIGTFTPTATLDVNGNASIGSNLYVNGNINLASGKDVCIQGGNCLSTVDTNAGTICPDNQFLNGDGSCDAGFLDADGIDDDQPDNDAEVPNAITVAGGSLGSNTITAGSAWTLGGTLNIDSNTLVVDGANNRVGIGTATPGAKLDVAGNIQSSGDYYGGARLYPAYTTNPSAMIDGSTAGQLNINAPSYVTFYVNGAEQLSVAGNKVYTQPNVKVGLGISNPETRLHTEDATAANSKVIFRTTDTGANPQELSLEHISVSPAAGDNIGRILFVGNDSDNTVKTFSSIESRYMGSGSSKLYINNRQQNNINPQITIDGTAGNSLVSIGPESGGGWITNFRIGHGGLCVGYSGCTSPGLGSASFDERINVGDNSVQSLTKNITGVYEPDIRIVSTNQINASRIEMSETAAGNGYGAMLAYSDTIIDGIGIYIYESYNHTNNIRITSTGLITPKNLDVGGAVSTGNGGIKWKTFSGTTDGIGTANFAHGLTGSKIIDVRCSVEHTTGNFYPVIRDSTRFTEMFWNTVNIYFDSNDINFYNSPYRCNAVYVE